MAKLTLTDIITGYASANLLNANNALIEAALENTLSRDGTAPNTMSADIDLNTNDLLNAGTVTAAEVTVGGISMAATAAAAAASAAAALASETAAATSETNAATSESNASSSATLASQWATLLDALVAATDYSAKEYAIGTFTRGMANGGSAKDWATYTGGTADDTEYSAKEYAIGTNVAAGSAKDWATQAEDSLVDGSGYSAFHWAQKAMAIVGTANVAISSNDTTMDYLINKLTALHGLTWTELNDGGNEDLQLSIGTHLEIGGGANNHSLNVYRADSNAVGMHCTNLTTGNLGTDGAFLGLDTSEQLLIWNYENTETLFAINADEKMRLTTNGNLLFDTTSDASGYRIRCHDNSTSGAQYIRFGNTTTGTLTSRGIVVGMNASEEMVIQNLENTATRFYTNNALRWNISAAGGLYANLATGGDKGNGTINADGAMYVDGQIVTGSAPATANQWRRGYVVYTVDKALSADGAITSADLAGSWTKATWESLGPTGSGATNIDAFLNVINDMSNCSGIVGYFDGSGTATASTRAGLSARYTMDATHATYLTPFSYSIVNGLGSAQLVAMTGGANVLSCNNDGVMELFWTSSGQTSDALLFVITGMIEGEAN